MVSFSPSVPSSRSKLWPFNLLNGLLGAIDASLTTTEYADKILEQLFRKNRKWGSRDRRLVAETFYDIVRWRGLLEGLCRLHQLPASPLTFWLVYERRFRQRSPRDLAACLPEPFPCPMAVRRWLENGAPLDLGQPGHELEPYELLSYPAWLYQEFLVASQGLQMMEALNTSAPVFLRANSLKLPSFSDLPTILEREGVKTVACDETPGALKLAERMNVFVTKAFKDGLFEVQDLASQKVSLLLDPKPGEKVADMCAGAGGKTLHLAALMKNKGRLLAFDVSRKKLEALKIRQRRAGVSNLSIHLIETTKDIKRHYGTCDRVLIDAPCSGSGVIRRNPDTKWKLTPERYEELQSIQERILDDYSRLVKPGGRLVYATCSVFNRENDQQVARFIKAHPEFSPAELLRTSPADSGQDGFFAQALIKNA